MKNSIASIFLFAMLNPALAGDGYKFKDVEARTQEAAEIKATLNIYAEVSDNVPPEFLKMMSSIAFSKVASQYHVEQLIGHKQQFTDDVRVELERSTAGKVAVEKVQVENLTITEEFR